jgi:4-hydroxy-tetrahydrodipicolinate synthase
MSQAVHGFQGSWVAMVTPFRDNAIDEAKVRELVDFHVKGGTDGLIPCGTTGESPTLTHDEHRRLIDLVIEAAAGRIPVVERAGARGALVVNPYYNKPTQEGLYRHYRAVAESVALPILVYNIQSRTAVNVETDTLARLVRDCRNIVGVKEASGSLDQMSQVIQACGPDFSVLSGDDNLTLPLLAIGGRGVVSVIANIVPRETAEMVHAALDGDFKRARDLHHRLFPLARAAFLETNPIPWPARPAGWARASSPASARVPSCDWWVRSRRQRIRRSAPTPVRWPASRASGWPSPRTRPLRSGRTGSSSSSRRRRRAWRTCASSPTPARAR